MSTKNRGRAGWIVTDPGVGSKAEGVQLYGVRLTEDHPGQNAAFDVLLGTWDSSAHSFDYSDEETVKAIDLRYGVPYPEATEDDPVDGVAVKMASDSYTSIYLIIDLDCE